MIRHSQGGLVRNHLFVIPLILLFSCSGSGTKYVRVTEMAVIAEPSNLLDTQECKTLWVDIQKAGLRMDEFGENWNEVILDNAYQLVEKGCVERRGVAE